jgi:hypothetical protein
MNLTLTQAAVPVGVREESTLGALPLVAFIAAAGSLGIAVADTMGRMSVPGAPLAWWVGFLAIILPGALRLLGRDATRGERLAIVALLGLALYGVKVLLAPTAFAAFDEFHHWATLDDIVVSGHLFTPNNILLASPYYPGLEIVSDLLVRSGFSVWEAGVVVVGAARLLMVLALFLLFERAAGDARVASVATLIYAANPSFLFFDSQYAYESLALPLAVFTFWCVQRREDLARSAATGSRATGYRATGSREVGSEALALTVCLMLGSGAVIVTHHITSLAFAAFLVAWAIVGWLRRGHGERLTSGLVGPALLAVTATVAWMLFVASVTVGYLAPAFEGTLQQVISLIAGDEGSRELFRAATGGAAPIWEQALGYASVAIVVASLPLGLVVLWRRYRQQALAVTLGLAAMLYPATLIARLTAQGAELAARSTEFIFLGAGFVVAISGLAVLDALTGSPAPLRSRLGRLPGVAAVRTGRWRGVGRPLAVLGVVVLFMGGAVLATPAWARLPGPYLVSADPRSIGPQGIAAASWTLQALGPGHRFLSDRTNRTLLATYGRQHPISAVGDQVDVKTPYFDTTLSAADLRVLRRAHTGYVIADMRLPTSLPYVGVYVERGELNTTGTWLTPMPAAALTKWDATKGADRIYDSGDIRIFDIRSLTDASS